MKARHVQTMGKEKFCFLQNYKNDVPNSSDANFLKHSI